MFRGVLAITLIFSMLVSQLAAVRHSHAGMSTQEQLEHDAHPHVHSSSHAAHSHHHSHQHHSHSRHHHAQNSTNADPVQCAVDTDHDADAIYLHVPNLTNDGRAKADQQIADNSLSFDTVCLFDLAPRTINAHWHPPDKPQSISDIYLLLRNLRI